MTSLIIGALAMGALWWTVERARKRGVPVAWWGWALTVLEILYGVFVLELIVGFLAEGEPRAALVMGVITGLFALIGAVLLARFVFRAGPTRGEAGA